MDIVQLSANRFVNLAQIAGADFRVSSDGSGLQASVRFPGGSVMLYSGMDAENLREALEDAAEESSYRGFRDTEPEDEDDWTPSEEYELGGEGGHGS